MMNRIRAALWALGLTHWNRHQDADETLAGLDARDRRDREALARLKRETEAMHHRLRIIEERQNIQRRPPDV